MKSVNLRWEKLANELARDEGSEELGRAWADPWWRNLLTVIQYATVDEDYRKIWRHSRGIYKKIRLALLMIAAWYLFVAERRHWRSKADWVRDQSLKFHGKRPEILRALRWEVPSSKDIGPILANISLLLGVNQGLDGLEWTSLVLRGACLLSRLVRVKLLQSEWCQDKLSRTSVCYTISAHLHLFYDGLRDWKHSFNSWSNT